MQRIDENTYIDDTLVTCAEYQLFIDEMREQGRYYQPDHWTSYQFSKGQALNSILGIRQTDADAFCEWLSSREKDNWKFRLPTREEAEVFPIKYLEKSSIGYWIDKEFQFVWVGTPSQNASAIDINRADNPHHNLTGDIVSDGNVIVTADDLGLVRTLCRMFDPAQTVERIHALDQALKNARNNDYEEYIDLFTLQERIAGRSPAFEGIRLVKERTK